MLLSVWPTHRHISLRSTAQHKRHNHHNSNLRTITATARFNSIRSYIHFCIIHVLRESLKFGLSCVLRVVPQLGNRYCVFVIFVFYFFFGLSRF